MTDRAPLFPLAGVPTPAGAAEWLDAADGARLRATLFPAVGSARGSVILSPGRTEPIEKYIEVAGRLTQRGCAVLVHDWRGQGLSTRALANRALGHAKGWAPFLSDHRRLLDAFDPRLPRPWLALGHSMGGCLVLLALAEGETRFAAALLSAPMLGLRTEPVVPWLARLLARGLTRLGMGGAPVARGAEAAAFATNILTHDRERWERNEALFRDHPELALGLPTWGWLDFAFSATGRLAHGSGTPRIAIPVTICLAGEERLVDNVDARAVAARLPHGRFVEIPGAFHEILQETDATQAPFWDEFDLMARTALAAVKRRDLAPMTLGGGDQSPSPEPSDELRRIARCSSRPSQ